jgi:hypothetical protein
MRNEVSTNTFFNSWIADILSACLSEQDVRDPNVKNIHFTFLCFVLVGLSNPFVRNIDKILTNVKIFSIAY